MTMLIVKRKMNKLIKKIMAAIIAATFIIATPAVNADAMTVKQVNSAIEKVKKRISKNKKAYDPALAEDNRINSTYHEIYANLYCNNPFILFDDKLNKHLLFDDTSGLVTKDAGGHLYSGVVYITDETMQFNGTVVYKARVVEYSHKATDLKNAINSDNAYLKQLKNSKKELLAIDGVTLNKGDPQKLVTHFSYGTEGINTLTWKSSAPNTVSVSKDGTVTGKKKGLAVISAKLSVTGKTYRTVVNVQ